LPGSGLVRTRLVSLNRFALLAGPTPGRCPRRARGTVEGEGVDSCPPCSICQEVNAVATLSTRFPLLPEFSGKVEEQLRLYRDVAKAGRRPKGDATGPLDVLEPRFTGSCSTSGAVLYRCFDDQLPGSAPDVTQPNLGAYRRSLRHGVSEPAHVVADAVVHDCDARGVRRADTGRAQIRAASTCYPPCLGPTTT
jgi:hypothetical protein